VGSRSSRAESKDRDGELAVVGPRTSVQVVRADHRPYVVDHHDLGVYVHRSAVGVRDVIHREPLAAGRCAKADGVLAADLPGADF